MRPTSSGTGRRLALGLIGLVVSVALADAESGPQLPTAPPALAPRHGVHLAPATAPAIPDNPIADPKAIVCFGRARFTVLTPELVRLEWSADGTFEDHASTVFLNRRLRVPRFEQEHSGDGRTLTLRTRALTLTYTPGTEGRFAPENLSITLQVDGRPVVWHPLQADPDNLLGTTRTLDGAQGDRTVEPIEPGLISRSGWALVDDSIRPLFDSADFSFRQGERSPWPWALERPAGERQDWYFFGYGHDYRKALGDYVRVAGRIPLPPRFAFGTWWSRYWAYSDQEIQRIVQGFHDSDVPLDVFVIDMDWHPTFPDANGKLDASGHAKGWSGYSWNRLLFPDPDQFLAQLHADGLKVSLNLHPASGIQPWEDHYPEMARAMGVDPATQQYIPFDITDKRFATNYLDLIHHPLERQGIDFWWLDWQQEQTTKIPGVSPTWWLNYVHFTDQQREGKRPLLFHRWGGLGNHRYQIGFSGDTASDWESLAFQPWFTATAANVGYAYWSHDIGGHLRGPVEPELFTRWVQFGAFSPILRTHTTKNPEAERRIWAYPEPYASILRSTFKLRYALQPYLYTEGRRTYDTGVAFLRPLYYDWPEENSAYQSRGEYVFGDQLLAAPVTHPVDRVLQLASEPVWIPPGEWIEWPTGRHFTGPVTVERSFSIDQIPVYVRAGAIVPMQPAMRYTGEKPVDPLILTVWPLAPGAASSYEVYEDSGASVAYQDGVFARTPIRANQEGDELRVVIGPVQGRYPGLPSARRFELRLPADWPPDAVRVNGVAVKQAQTGRAEGWHYEGNTLTTCIPTPRTRLGAKVTVQVHWAAGLIGRRAQLDGFAGAMTRLRSAYDGLRRAWPVADAPDVLVDAMQTGDRLGYHPEHASETLAHYREMLPQARAAVDTIAAGFAAHVTAFAEELAKDHRPADSDAQRQQRLDAVARAQRLVAEAAK